MLPKHVRYHLRYTSILTSLAKVTSKFNVFRESKMLSMIILQDLATSETDVELRF